MHPGRQFTTWKYPDTSDGKYDAQLAASSAALLDGGWVPPNRKGTPVTFRRKPNGDPNVVDWTASARKLGVAEQN